jgi:two-component system CheB/CheR fusion protein
VAIGGLILLLGDVKTLKGTDILRILCVIPVALIISILYSSRAKAENMLRERDARLALVSNQIPGGLWSTDNELRVTSGFGAQSALLHGPAGQTLYDHFGTTDATFPAIEAHRRALRGESSTYEMEWGGRTFQSYVEPLRGVDGNIIGVVGVATDITDRKRSEQERERLVKALETQRSRLDAIIESMPAGVVVAEVPSGKIVLHNAQVEEILRHPVIDTPDVDAYERWGGLHPNGERVEAHEYPLARGLRGEITRNKEIMYQRGDGSKGWISISGAPIYDSHGNVTGSVAVFYDVDANKRAQEEITRAKQQLEAANKAKDQFLAMLSHELRTPLTPVLALASTLQSRGDLPAEVRDDMETIRRNVELEATLIDDLLDLTRISRGKLQLNLQDVDAHDLLENALHVCDEDITNKHINIWLEMKATRHFVRADPARLQQVFWNLIKNAVKFTPSGGSVRIITENDENGRLRVDVSDTGIGITREMLPRVFDAFEQGPESITRRFGGLGLGLAISKTLVELHRGKIEAKSDGAGEGATFTMDLATIEKTAPATGDAQASPNVDTSLDILLVEDHPDTSRVMKRLLTKAGHRVSTAATVAEALASLEDRRVQLLISDLGLPDGNGVELMKEVARRFGIKGIALSGFGTDADVQQCIAAGFEAHLTKPVHLSTLRQTIAKVAHGTRT